METKIEGLRICRVCRWVVNSIHRNTLMCVRAIPDYIPQEQIFEFRKALVKKHWDLDCEKFHHRQMQ